MRRTLSKPDRDTMKNCHAFEEVLTLVLAGIIFISASWASAEDERAGANFTTAISKWQDTSTHQAHFVSVEEGLQLEVLDWGGSGRAIVLLAASGCTAHEFDDFAPKLTDRYHVY